MAILIIAATYYPLSKGAKKEAFGNFTPIAETLNGRLAMIGFGSLLLLEAVTKSAFF